MQQHPSTGRFGSSQGNQHPLLRTLRSEGANGHSEAFDGDSYDMACQQQVQKVLFSPSFYRLGPWGYSVATMRECLQCSECNDCPNSSQTRVSASASACKRQAEYQFGDAVQRVALLRDRPGSGQSNDICSLECVVRAALFVQCSSGFEFTASTVGLCLIS